VRLPVDDDGEVWIKAGDEDRFNVGHDGAHLFLPFQCDICWFRNLKGRDPEKDKDRDKLLLITIRRVNLLGMWGSEPTTTNGHRLNIIKGVKLLRLVGLSPNYPPLGPFPLGDTLGYGLAIEMMLRSLSVGKQITGHVGFDTVRKQRSAYTGVWRSAASGQSINKIVSGNASKKMMISSCPAYTLWMEHFVKGLEKFMGRATIPDLALDMKVMVAVMNNLEIEWNQKTDLAERRDICFLGLFLIAGVVAGLRGYEIMFMDLFGLISKQYRGRDHKTHPHIIVPLLGRFKGLTGERLIDFTLPLITKSGFQPAIWIDRVVEVHMREGRKNGPVFVNTAGRPCRSNFCENRFIEMLEQVRLEQPELIDKDLDLLELVGVSRTLRRTSNTKARLENLSDSVIDRWNRWRKVERSRSGEANLEMRERYEDYRLMISSLLLYPLSM